MKVLHVAPSLAQSYGGPTQSLAGYTVVSRLAGIDVSIVAPRCAPADLAPFVARAGQTDLHLFRTVGSGAFAISPALVRWVRRHARSFDVVHVHGLFNPISSLSARTALRSGTAVVVRPFGTLSRYTFRHRRTALKRAWFALIERRNLQAASALHFTSATERSEADWHGIDFTGRAYVVPPPAAGAVVRSLEHGEIQDGARVLFLGRINPVKNLESLLDAWLFVRNRLPEAVLEVAGDGDSDYIAALHHRAAINGIADSVVFHGFVSGAPKEKLLASASVLVLPSHHENFGLAALEAVEAGVPVIVSPEVHLADFVRSENVGEVVASNPSLLADAITDVIADDQIRSRTREFGADIVARNFSSEAIGALLSTMYRAAIERSRLIASS